MEIRRSVTPHRYTISWYRPLGEERQRGHVCGRHGLHGKSGAAPAAQPILNDRDAQPQFAQLARDAHAGGLALTGAVQVDLTLRWEVFEVRAQRIRINAPRLRNAH